MHKDVRRGRKKKEHNGGVEHPVTIESNLARLDIRLPGSAFQNLDDPLFSSDFLVTVTSRVKDLSYEKTAQDCNNALQRDEDHAVTRSTVVTCVKQAGEAIQAYKDREADAVLQERGIFQEDGIVKDGAEIPEDLRSRKTDRITINPDLLLNHEDQKGLQSFLHDLTVPEALRLSPEELAELGAGPSEPFHTNAVYPRRRRTSRTEADDEAKQYILEQTAAWLNANDSIDPSRKILREWSFEKSSGQTVYISIDAVLVAEQCKVHVSGGKCAMRDEKSYIKHWTIHVEADGRIYRIHHLVETEAYKQLLALLIRNDLLGRYLVFFTDGETKIYEAIERYFGSWDHEVYLDYHHLQEKIYGLMSYTIVAKRVDDPAAPTEYYKTGSRKGQPKPAPQTSLSRLYAKEASLMAWVGNVAALIAYIKLIPDEYIKSEAGRQQLLTYLENKQDWITCYSLRKKVGLKNSSNSVELTNQLLVSERQKSRLMSWRDRSSSDVASITSVYLNGEAEQWFREGTLSFELKAWDSAQTGAA